MNPKYIFTIVNILSLIALIIVTAIVQKKLNNKKEEHVAMLRGILFSASLTLLTNILIANATSEAFASFAYSSYYASMDWVVFFLCFFSVSYTENNKNHKIYNFIKGLGITICLLDNLFIFSNLISNYIFEIHRETDSLGIDYYISYFSPIYNIHLTIDYLMVAISTVLLIIACVKNHSFYKLKYITIIGIVALIVIVNIVYLAFTLALDWSVFLYAIAGFLVYYYSMLYVPNHIKSSFFGFVVSQMNEGLIIFDKDNKCVYINEACSNALNMKIQADDITKSEILKLLDKRENDMGDEYIDYSSLGNENELKRYKVSKRDICDNKNNILGSFFIFDDVTREYNAFIKMTEARLEADEANKAKSIFLANMSHEIRTPINAVLGMNEMILRDSDDEKIIDYASNAHAAGRNLLALINDILDFSKIEAGKLEMVEDNYSLHDLIREIYLMLSPKAAVKDLDFTISMTDDIPTTLLGDRKRVMQILLNIINNAVKYTNQGSINVNVSHAIKEDGKALITVAVKDTGIGISKENQAKLFNAFQRVDLNKNKNIEGTGLGLALAKQLAEMMDGDISIDSQEGKGSTFTVSILQAVTDSTAGGSFDVKATKAVEKTNESFTAPDARVLVVDDIEMNIVVVQALLERNRLQVYTATGGNEAIDLCNETKFDLILMDHMMPSPDGIETLKIIKEGKGLNWDTPQIVLTANAISGVDNEYKQAGFIDYISKPVSGDELEAIVKKYLPEEKIL